MIDFFPFIHEKKKENEPIPLYIELIPPIPEVKEEKDDDNTDGVIIIQL